MVARRGRLGTGLLAPLGVVVAAVVLVGCGQTTDPAGPVVGTSGTATTAPSDAPTATTEDETSQDDAPTGPGSTPESTGPELLLPSPPLGGSGLPADPAGAELTVVAGGPGAGQGPVTLSCDWTTGVASGSHPRPDQACADLLAAIGAGDPFAPVAPDTMCTQVYGGDAVAEVTGAVLDAEGGQVDVAARFSLTNGCEIDRWQRLGALLSPYGGAGGTTT